MVTNLGPTPEGHEEDTSLLPILAEETLPHQYIA